MSFYAPGENVIARFLLLFVVIGTLPLPACRTTWDEGGEISRNPV